MSMSEDSASSASSASSQDSDGSHASSVQLEQRAKIFMKEIHDSKKGNSCVIKPWDGKNPDRNPNIKRSVFVLGELDPNLIKENITLGDIRKSRLENDSDHTSVSWLYIPTVYLTNEYTGEKNIGTYLYPQSNPQISNSSTRSANIFKKSHEFPIYFT